MIQAIRIWLARRALRKAIALVQGEGGLHNLAVMARANRKLLDLLPPLR